MASFGLFFKGGGPGTPKRDPKQVPSGGSDLGLFRPGKGVPGTLFWGSLEPWPVPGQPRRERGPGTPQTRARTRFWGSPGPLARPRPGPAWRGPGTPPRPGPAQARPGPPRRLAQGPSGGGLWPENGGLANRARTRFWPGRHAETSWPAPESQRKFSARLSLAARYMDYCKKL